MFLGVLYTIRLSTKWFKTFLRKVADFLVNLVVFNFILWYIFENSLNFYVPYFKEITLYRESKVNLGLLISASILVVALSVFWIIMLIHVFIKFHKINEKSKMATLKSGLNERSRYSMVFYLDYFVFRFLISIMVPITLNTAALFSIALVVQLFTMHLKLCWVYRTKKLAFIAYLAE